MSERARVGWLPIVFRVVLALIGLGVIGGMVHTIGPAEIAAAVLPALAWLPLAALLELARIGCDAMATRFVLGERGRAVPLTILLAAHLAAHAVMNVMPAGRGSSEIVKATLFGPYVGGGPAVAMGTTNQANLLIASATFSLFCAAAAWLSAVDSLVVIAIVVHFVVLFVSGLAMRVGATDPRFERLLASRFPRLAARMELFHTASRETRLLEPAPILVMMLGRAIQTAQYAVLAMAVGVPMGVLGALTVQGINLVAAAVGVMVPGQLGSAEAIFAGAADAMGTTVARATSIALLAHAMQVVFVSAGLLVLLLWRDPEKATAKTAAQ